MKKLRFRAFEKWMLDFKEHSNLTKEDFNTYMLFMEEFVNARFTIGNRKKSLLFNDTQIDKEYRELKADSKKYKEFQDELSAENSRRNRNFAKYVQSDLESYIKAKKPIEDYESLNNKKRPNKFKHLSAKEFLIIKKQRELNNNVTYRRKCVLNRDIYQETKDLHDEKLNDSINAENYHLYKKELTEIEEEFLDNLKANTIQIFVYDNIIYLLDLLSSINLEDNKKLFAELASDLNETYNIYANKKISLNNFYIFAKKTLKVVEILIKFKKINTDNESNKVIKYLDNIFTKMIFIQNVNKTNVKKHILLEEAK